MCTACMVEWFKVFNYKAQEAMATLEEAITYVAVAYGEASPIKELLIQQAEDTRQSVDKMVSNSTVKQAAKCSALVASATQEQNRFRQSLSLLGQCHRVRSEMNRK